MAKVPRSGIVIGDDGRARCYWGASDPLYRPYHDEEWGRPVADDTRLFEKLCLEGFQAGLSWLTILRKRENFRRAFKDFDFAAVARFNRRSVERLLGRPARAHRERRVARTPRGPAQARLSFRGPHHQLCLHAGHGPGERSSRGLPRARAGAPRAPAL